MNGEKLRGKTLFIIAAIAGIAMLFVGEGWADIPAPTANQSLGFYDTIFSNLVQEDCRVCHDDPIIAGSTPNVDRHHLLYGSPLAQGECSVNRNACLSDADCNAAICSAPPVESCSDDIDCDNFALGETCGEVCIGETIVPNLDANQDGSDDTYYGCLNCHNQDTSGGITTFLVERNCLQCHVQVPGEGSVHHLTPMAQGGDSPLGDPSVGDCTPCHGTVVDDIGDGHTIPVYSPSFVTPSPSGGEGLPLNSRGNGAGACNYCHDDGTDNATGVQVFTNSITHHNTGVFQSETGVVNDDTCLWCHSFLPPEYAIRTCEGCHGMESLHNIQADSDGDCDIQVGDELPGYGHVGADNPGAGSDCWGCHGFSFAGASAPGAGPTAPFISSSDVLVITAGSDTPVNFYGSGFTNTLGAYEWTSNVVLTAGDNSSIELTPDAVDACSCTVTIPGTTAPGNYILQAVKNGAASNPVVLSIKPAVAISSTTCQACLGVLTINGSGFGDVPPEGSQDYINVEQDGIKLGILSWTDTKIQVSGASCNFDSVTVNAVSGSTTKRSSAF